MSIDLTQAEADALISMPKRPSTSDLQQFPSPGGKLVIPLESIDRSEDFLLDITRSRMDFSRITYQNRGRMIIGLLRLDLKGSPHRNPDDTTVPCPHLHIYREGYGDKWAFLLPGGKFGNLDDLFQTFFDFLAVCNVVEHPALQTGLF
jgi:hypothetical protein